MPPTHTAATARVTLQSIFLPLVLNLTAVGFFCFFWRCTEGSTELHLRSDRRFKSWFPGRLLGEFWCCSSCKICFCSSVLCCRADVGFLLSSSAVVLVLTYVFNPNPPTPSSLPLTRTSLRLMTMTYLELFLYCNNVRGTFLLSSVSVHVTHSTVGCDDFETNYTRACMTSFTLL